LVKNSKHIAVFMGGMSAEHEISLSSGKGVVEALNERGYRVTPVTIARDGAWLFPDGEPLDLPAAAAKLCGAAVDCVFIALHGTFGEDGRIQAFLDLLNIPYTGSGCAASALAMDKIRCKALVNYVGLRVAPHLLVKASQAIIDAEAIQGYVEGQIGFPCVIKPPCEGSSVAVEIVQAADDFPEALVRVLQHDGTAMVEAYLKGPEVTCGVLETNDGVRALPVTEIRPVTADFFDYGAKYTPGATEEITPAPIDEDLTEKVQQMAVDAHRSLGCKGWSRSDFIMDDEGPVFIETNTVPGLTPTSLYPQAAAAEGISYGAMLEMFVEYALEGVHTRESK
jgi:D-alanine-D-alanine ligase